MQTQLRIADLKRRGLPRKVIMNVALPVQLHDAIAQLARRFRVPKNAVMAALLNEGLTVAARKKLVRDGRRR